MTAGSTAVIGGPYTVTITGTSGALTASTTLSVSVTAAPGYTLSSSAASLSIPQSNSGTSTITINQLSGFSGTVTLAASGLPKRRHGDVRHQSHHDDQRPYPCGQLDGDRWRARQRNCHWHLRHHDPELDHRGHHHVGAQLHHRSRGDHRGRDAGQQHYRHDQRDGAQRLYSRRNLHNVRAADRGHRCLQAPTPPRPVPAC